MTTTREDEDKEAEEGNDDEDVEMGPLNEEVLDELEHMVGTGRATGDMALLAKATAQ